MRAGSLPCWARPSQGVLYSIYIYVFIYIYGHPPRSTSGAFSSSADAPGDPCSSHLRKGKNNVNSSVFVHSGCLPLQFQTVHEYLFGP